MDTSQLTFTRFIAAILIVIFHFAEGSFPFNQPIISSIVVNANYGVSYFFLLSGFVMAVAYSKKSEPIKYKAFLKNRLARIFPLYILAMLAMLLYYYLRIEIMGMASNYTPKIFDVVLNFLMLQSWVPDKAMTVNVPAWSLSVEWFFYVSFPFLLNYVYQRISFKKLGISIMVFFILSQILFNAFIRVFPRFGLYFMYNPLFHLNSFVVGNFVGLYFITHKPISSAKLYIGLLLSVISIAAINYLSKGWVIFTNGLFLIVFVPLLLIFAYNYSPISNIFRKKFLQYLGEISYGIYILQFPLYFFFTALLTFSGHKINSLLFIVYLCLLILASAFSYNYIEKPLRDRIKNIRFV